MAASFFSVMAFILGTIGLQEAKNAAGAKPGGSSDTIMGRALLLVFLALFLAFVAGRAS